MEAQIRSTGGERCPTCGAGELVYAGGKPATRDLTRVLEREILRREIATLKVLRAHLNQSDADHADALTATRQQHRAELYELTQEHNAVLGSVKRRLEETKVDVPGWRLARRRRERLFAERIDAVVEELFDSTRHGSR